MPTQLLVIAGPDAGLAFPLNAGAPLLIGRGQASSMKLVDPAVSRVHCEVRWDGRQAVVTDNASASGTFVNGCQVRSHNLRAGDVIKIGNSELRFESTVEDDKTLPPDVAPRPTTAATAPEQPPKEVVFAQKIGGRQVPAPIKQLQEMVGQTIENYQLLKIVGTGQIGVVFQALDGKGIS
jgi:pSer/pThr/pTyr-binding forkhead associated (FHA) protein